MLNFSISADSLNLFVVKLPTVAYSVIEALLLTLMLLLLLLLFVYAPKWNQNCVFMLF